MTTTPFDAYLARGESTEIVGSGTLFQETAWRPSAIAVTDRRILFVPAEGGFVDVPRDQVGSIRSRPTSRRTNREIGGLTLLVAGVALAVAAAVALIAATEPLGSGGGLAIPLLAFATGLGTIATAALVYSGVELTADHVAVGLDAIDDGLARADDALEGVGSLDDVDAHRRNEERLARRVECFPLLRWLAAVGGVGGATGLVGLGAWLALGLTAAGVVGVGAAAYGLEYVRALGERGQRVRRERDVVLSLLGGRTVRFRIDDEADIDRELGKRTARGPRVPLARDEDDVAVAERPTETGTSTGP